MKQRRLTGWRRLFLMPLLLPTVLPLVFTASLVLPGTALASVHAQASIAQSKKVGKITEFSIPTANSAPNGITQGPDGALWFTEGLSNKIGRITTAGTITEFSIPKRDHNKFPSPTGITQGPDGALWFTEHNGNRIGRITAQ